MKSRFPELLPADPLLKSRGLALDPARSVSAWAEENRVLSSHDSAEPGLWKNSRTPYLTEIMDELSPRSPIQEVVVVAGAQLGKTSVGLNWVGFAVHLVPAPTLIVQPTIDMAKRFSKQRLDALFEQSPCFQGLIQPARARDSGNAILSKEFPGGVLILTGANSPTGLRSMPVRYLFLDEVDAYPADADNEGDPVSLAKARTETFHKRKILMVSTPSVQGYSRIQAAYDETDQRRFYVPCLHCGQMDVITWSRIKWPKDEPQGAYLVCESCGGVMTNQQKPLFLQHGEWRQTVTGADPRVAGFHVSGLCSPWRSWGDIAAEHLRVHKDPARMQVFVNIRLGECWEDQAGETVKTDPLAARREDYTPRTLPFDIKAITAGVDVQADRLEVQVVGWGPYEEAWIVDYVVLWGDPSGATLWNDLDELLKRTYRNTEGFDLPILATAIDTGGHHTKAVYNYCGPRLSKRVWAIKGRGGPGVPVWPRRVKRQPGRVPLFIVGVDAAKDALYARLRMTSRGPGFVHFNADLDMDYFHQLTSEKVVTTHVRGRPVRAWHPRYKGDRNEALDTFVYAMAAMQGLVASGLQIRENAAVVPDVVENDDADTTPPPTPVTPRRPVREDHSREWIDQVSDNWL